MTSLKIDIYSKASSVNSRAAIEAEIKATEERLHKLKQEKSRLTDLHRSAGWEPKMVPTVFAPTYTPYAGVASSDSVESLIKASGEKK